jgi:predicted nucleotidyltransferase
MATGRSELLGALAERVASALPAKIVEEVVLTGSVSRGVADEVSDIEMLVITGELLELDECFELARGAGLEELDTWGAREGPARRVFGYRETVPMEMVWWSRDYAEAQVGAALAGEASSIADALAYGLPLRTTGLLERWQAWLSEYPPELAAARIEDAALPWGGFAPAGVLTLIRPDDRLVLAEWLVDAAKRVLTIVFALNHVWQPTTKRLAARVAPLPIKPERLAARIDDALSERDSRRALLAMTELQLDAVLLAPEGPNIDRARRWLAPAAELLRS